MIKLIVEIEEKSTLNFKNVEAKDMSCNIEELKFNATKAENIVSKDLIKRITKGKNTDVIDKTNKDRQEIQELIKILSRI